MNREPHHSRPRFAELEEIPEMVLDMVFGLEGMVASKRSSERTREILSGLPARDRDLLRAVLSKGKDQDAVCREFGVDRDYLRVLLHRTKEKLKSLPASLNEQES